MFPGLVGTIGTHSNNSIKKTERPKTEVLASSQVMTMTDSGGAASPPPLPPRSRAMTTPPPPLPPREEQRFGTTAIAPTPSYPQPLKPRNKDLNLNGSSQRGVSPNSNLPNRTSNNPAVPGTIGSSNGAPQAKSPSATPLSSIDQLVQQTGLSAEEITKILMEHSVHGRNQQHQQPPPPPHPHSQQIQQHQQQVLPNRVSPAAYQQQQPPHHYNNTNHTLNSPPQMMDHRSSHHPQPNNGLYNGNGGGQPPPPPQYSSPHIINSQSTAANSGPPPPPYNTPHSYQHQPSPASSVTSGSSNDYLQVNYHYPNTIGEYRTPAYGESPSSGMS